MPDETIYEELGVPHVVNAAGTKTRIGGSRIRPEAVEAMKRASKAFVRLSDLQARASELITDVTDGEAGYVTAGAASALLLGTAACIANDDIGIMARLPDIKGDSCEVVIPRTHRIGYDHALRTAGAEVVDVGTNDHHLGTGSRNVEPWEIANAIGENTAAVGYVEKPYTEPPLEVVADVAHDHDIPVIVDAAAELPPTSNLSAFIKAGADLVAFSGGKAVRGPQTTGILAGREDLIESVAMQHLDMHAAEEVWEPPHEFIDPSHFGGVPRQGIGRPMKVGKEELIGLIRALELFCDEDYEALTDEWLERSQQIVATLDKINGFETSITPDEKVSVAPEVIVTVDSNLTGVSATDIVGNLRREEPRVFVGADDLPADKFTINPMCLTDEETDYTIERIEAQV
jgi:D-glucosaminate-6-phosphate ammonia-lyase